MTIGELNFDKSALLKAPLDEVRLFLALAHSSNEVNALLKFVLWTTDYSSENDVLVHGQVTFSYIVLRLLAGKLTEGYNILHKGFFGAGVSKSYHPLDANVEEALKTLKRYFNSRNLIREIRDRFSFHYDIQELSRVLPLVDEELVAYLQKGGSINNLYYLAEVIASTAAVTATGTKDIEQALTLFTEELLSITQAFSIAADAIIAEFFKRNPDVTSGKIVEVELPELIPTTKLKLPWFTDPADLESSAAQHSQTEQMVISADKEKEDAKNNKTEE